MSRRALATARWVAWTTLLGAGSVAVLALLRMAYPLAYRDVIEREAARYGFDPLFLAAVVFVESRFDPHAVSARGARGLMQLMPETAAWAAQRLGLEPVKPDDLFIPELNIRLGTWYLAQLRRQFNGDTVLMLAAYNGGAGNVRNWAAGAAVGDPAAALEQRLESIPFGETRRFVRRVLDAYRVYRLLYRPLDREGWLP